MAKKRRTRKPASPFATSGAMTEMATLGFVAPFVIASRMTGMWLNAFNPTAAGRRENSRMVSEKLTAAGESALAVSDAVAREAMKAGAGMMTAGAKAGTINTDALLSASRKPYTRRVKANARRLSRKK